MSPLDDGAGFDITPTDTHEDTKATREAFLLSGTLWLVT